MRRSNWIGFLGIVVISLAVVIATSILGNAVIRARSDSEMIRVTGSARRPITSDFIIWRGRLSYRGSQVSSAYDSLKAGMKQTTDYLKSKGIPEKEIVTNAITTQTLYAPLPPGQEYAGENTNRPITGYQLSQSVEVRSGNVALVDKVSREVTDLIANGVALESDAPQYLYTKISEVKVEILAEAAKDARRRADEIAKNSGAAIGDVRFARMSPLQITPIYSNEVSGEGINDTTSLDKAITAIVTMGFAVK
jgi:hypothetical protein